jgi:hypothetical protein
MPDEKTDAPILPKDFDIKRLPADMLDGLSADQINYIQVQESRKGNPAIFDCVQAALKGKEDEVIGGLAKFPPVFISPEITLLPSMKVSFRSLFDRQVDDAMAMTKKHMSGDISDLQATTFMAKAFLAHGIENLNGQPFGDIVLSTEAVNMLVAGGKDGDEALMFFREKRMRALSMYPERVIALLVNAHQAFQQFYDGVVNLRGSPEEITAKVKKMAESVGKSTGPQVAGQNPT